MMRKFILVNILLLFMINIELKAQETSLVEHSFTYKTLPYYNYLNGENTPFTFRKAILLPALSYKVFYNHFGLELFYNHHGVINYEPGEYPVPALNSTMFSEARNLGLVAHYSILNKKGLKVNPFLGMIARVYDQDLLTSILLDNEGHPFWGWESYFIECETDLKLGLNTGIDIQIPIYKRFYFNTTMRYSYIPTSHLNKQNLSFELGIGFIFSKRSL